jgi:hypothetical protein
MPLFAIIWGYLWFSGIVADAPGSVTPAFVEWAAYIIPAVVFIATLFGAVMWVRHCETEST